MKRLVDLYDSHYGNVEAEVYRAVRVETYGEDLGQTSWITAAEIDEFSRWLNVTAGQHVLEIACGSGGIALRIAERVSGSIDNPNRHAKRTPRRMRSGSSVNASGKIMRSVLDWMSRRPPSGSITLPSRTLLAIALIVKSRRARSSSTGIFQSHWTSKSV